LRVEATVERPLARPLAAAFHSRYVPSSPFHTTSTA